MKNLIPFLLLALSCNPAKQIQKNQAAIASIVDKANAERVIVKDSIIFLKGRVDTFSTKIVDSATHSVQTNNFYHSSDTLKIITNDPLLERALLERAATSEGKLTAVSNSIQQYETRFIWAVVIIGVLAFSLGAVIFFFVKL